MNQKKWEFKEEMPISKCYENKNGYSMQILKKCNYMKNSSLELQLHDTYEMIPMK